MSVDIFAMGDSAVYLLGCSCFRQFNECPLSGHTSNECRQAEAQLSSLSLFQEGILGLVCEIVKRCDQTQLLWNLLYNLPMPNATHDMWLEAAERERHSHHSIDRQELSLVYATHGRPNRLQSGFIGDG